MIKLGLVILHDPVTQLMIGVHIKVTEGIEKGMRDLVIEIEAIGMIRLIEVTGMIVLI